MKKIVIVGAGVAGINAATKLVDNGYPGELITIIDMGKDPYNRKAEEVMEGMLGAGGWSDGKLTYHTAIGGQLSKYCGEEKAEELFTHYHNLIQDIGGELGQEILVSILAKQCALFAAREVLKEKWNIDVPGSYDEYYYWEEVEHEIESYEE